jgi:hypothetical protein
LEKGNIIVTVEYFAVAYGGLRTRRVDGEKVEKVAAV